MQAATPSRTRDPTPLPSLDLPPIQTWATLKSRYVTFLGNTELMLKLCPTVATYCKIASFLVFVCCKINQSDTCKHEVIVNWRDRQWMAERQQAG